MRSTSKSAGKLAAAVASVSLALGVAAAGGVRTATAVDAAATADSKTEPKRTYLVNSDFEAYRNDSVIDPDHSTIRYIDYWHYNTIGEAGGTGYGVAECNIPSNNCRFPGFDPDKFGWKSTQKWGYYSHPLYDPNKLGYGSPLNEVKGDPAGGSVEINWERRADGTVNSFAELSAEEPGTSIYQDIDVIPGQRVTWSLDHASIVNDVEAMNVIIAPVGENGDETGAGVVSKAVRVSADGSKSAPMESISSPNHDQWYPGTSNSFHVRPVDWSHYESSDPYVVPDGVTKIRMKFKSLAYNHSSHGNIVDNVTMSPDHFAVAFDGNSGSGSMDGVSLTYGSQEYTLPPSSYASTRTGYRFAGWSTSRDGSTGILQPGDRYKVEGDVLKSHKVTFYAQWADVTTASLPQTGSSTSQAKTEAIAAASGGRSVSRTLAGGAVMEEEAEAGSVDDSSDAAERDGAQVSTRTCDHPDWWGKCDDSTPLHTFEWDGDPPEEYKRFQFTTNRGGVWQSAVFDQNWKRSSNNATPTAKGATVLLPSIGVWTDAYGGRHSVDGRLTVTGYASAHLTNYLNGLWLHLTSSRRGHLDLRVDFLYSGTEELLPAAFKGLTGIQDLDYVSDYDTEGVEFLSGVDGFWQRRDAHLKRWGFNGFMGTDDHPEQNSNTLPHDLQHTVTVAFSGPTMEMRYSGLHYRGAAFDVPMLKAAQTYNVTGRAVDQNGKEIKASWVLAGLDRLYTGASWDATNMAPAIPGYRLVGLADGSAPLKGTISDASRQVTWLYASLSQALPQTGAGTQPTSPLVYASLGVGLLLTGVTTLLAGRRRAAGRRVD